MNESDQNDLDGAHEVEEVEEYDDGDLEFEIEVGPGDVDDDDGVDDGDFDEQDDEDSNEALNDRPVAPRNLMRRPATEPSERLSLDEMFDFLPKPANLSEGERLQKVLARAGIGSRRVCEILIEAGRVRVNGSVAILGRRVDPNSDLIMIDGKPVGVREGLVYYLLNKPIGVVTTADDPQGRETVIDLVPAEPRVYPVGRLDVDTEGLLILTNDGELAHRIMHPSFGVQKEYLAEVRGEVTAASIRLLREGVQLDDGLTSPAEVSLLSPNLVRIAIHEGRNRQVRRMLEAVGHPVVRLARTRIHRLADRSLPPGRWRHLEKDEVRMLESAVKQTRAMRRHPE